MNKGGKSAIPVNVVVRVRSRPRPCRSLSRHRHRATLWKPEGGRFILN